MDNLLETLLAELERERGHEGSPSCLPDSVLEGFITGTLRGREIEAARAHVTGCVRCMHSYASLRRLLDLATAEEGTAPVHPQALGRLSARLATFCGSLFRRPIASGWALAGAVAAVFVTWLFASEIQVREVARPVWTPSEMMGLAHRADARSTTIRGTVDTVREATAHGVEAHILTITDASGATYVLFAWGAASVRPGQAIEVRAIFVPADEPSGAPTYKGMAQELTNRQGR